MSRRRTLGALGPEHCDDPSRQPGLSCLVRFVAHEGVAFHCVGNEVQLRSPEFQLFDQLRVCRLSSSFKTLICLLAKMLGVWHGVLPDFIISRRNFHMLKTAYPARLFLNWQNETLTSIANCIVNVLRAALRECTYP